MKSSELRASELRVGNITTLGVVSLIDQDVFRVVDSEGDSFKNTWAEIKPIPLTEEWLLNFGFDKVGITLTSIAIAPLNLPCTFNLPNTPFSFCQGKLILTTGTGDFCVNIEYVHQLQNLYFALTGEELKQQELCKCGQPKVGGYSCQRTDCNQNIQQEQ
jgi:hypothetical protein